MDPYEVLGIRTNATPKEVKLAYRRKAWQLHPDVNTSPDAVEQFNQVQQAYAQLMGKASEECAPQPSEPSPPSSPDEFGGLLDDTEDYLRYLGEHGYPTPRRASFRGTTQRDKERRDQQRSQHNWLL